MNTSSFTGEFVRQIARDAGLRDQVATALSSGQAFEDTGRLAVAMIDISGYSKMAADLTYLGKLAAEVITRSVGAYLNKIIDVIGLFRGDIVKFLGDAVLVVFSPRHPYETFDLIVLRATACCVAINAKYATMELDMRLAGMSTALHSGNYPSGKHQGQAGTAGALILHLHFAVAAGEVSRLIIGDWANRLDYSIYGDCLASLGPILDGTKKGVVGLKKQLLTFQAAGLIKQVLKGYQLSYRAPVAEGGLHILLDGCELSALMTVVFSTDEAGILSAVEVEDQCRAGV